jgi:hypothetical protein
MPNGPISNLEKTYSMKKLLFLSLAWGSLLGSVGIIVTLYLCKVGDLFISIVIFGLFIYLFLVLLFCKAKISFYDLQQRYQLLLDQGKGTEKTHCRFDNQWIDSLQKQGFQNRVNETDFAIFYKIDKSISKKTFLRTNLLAIISIVRNQTLDFYADVLENEFKRLWISLEKKHNLNKQVIIQFKKYEAFNDAIKNDLNRIISYKEGDNYLVNINCGYFSEDGSLYYLHADKYYPSIYYKYAVDTIKKITDC